MTGASCPLREQLAAFSSGDLSASELERIGQHVQDCDRCQQELDALSRLPDSIAAGLKEVGKFDPFTQEAHCRQGLERLQVRGRISQSDESTRIRLGQYELLSELGRGGMGTVYKALHPFLKRAVALKLLPAERLLDAQAVARFRREMEAIGKLQHANIVQATDAGESDGRHFLVMEYVDGRDLAYLVRERGPLPVADACEVVRQAALGLQHAHEHGMVHRDIKPSNLILTTSGQVKVLDLGLALLRGEMSEEGLTEVGQVMGTLDYMAPEQAFDAHRVDIRADIYSLGCTLFYLLCGRPPYAGSEFRPALQKMLAHAGASIPTLRSLRPEAPAALDAVLQRMLAKNSADRYATPRDVVAALAAYCAGQNLAALLRREKSPTDGAMGVPETVHALSTASVGTDSPGARRDAFVPPVPMVEARSGRAILSRRAASGLVAIAATCIGALLLAGVVFRLQTSIGTLVVEVDQPGAEIFVNGKKVEIQAPGSGEPIVVEVDEGKHELKVTKGGFETFSKQFTVKARGKETVHVHLEPLAAAEKKDNGPLKGELLYTLDVRKGQIPSIAFSPNGKWLLTSENRNSAIIWDAETGKLDHILPNHAPWQLPEHVPQDGLNGGECAVTFTPDGRPVAYTTLGSVLKVWDVRTGKDLYNLRGQTTTVLYLVFSPDGECFATCAHDRTVRIWDVHTGQERLVLQDLPERSLGVWGAIHSMGFSRDGRLLASGGVGQKITIWDPRTGHKLRTLHSSEKGLFRTIAFSPDGTRIVGADKMAQVWDAQTGQHLFSLGNGICKRVWSVAYSPNGRLLAGACDSVVRLWDAQSGTELLALSGHSAAVWPVAFSPDGRRLASACWEGQVKMWRLQGSYLEAAPAEAPAKKPIKPQLGNPSVAARPAESGEMTPVPTPASVDRLAAEWVLKKGGSILVDVAGRSLNQGDALPSVPFQVREISLVDRQLSSSDLSRFKGLKGLHTLDLRHTPVSDEGLRSIGELGTIRLLQLNRCPISDKGLESLKELRALEEIFLDGTKVNGSGLAYLKDLPKLRNVVLAATAVTNESLKNVRTLPNLSRLDLYETSVGDAGLPYLVGHVKLGQLSLAKTQVTDKGVAALRDLPGLWWLSLDQTQVSDASVEHLSAIKTLTYLGVSKTKITSVGLEKLQKSLPKCKIVRD